MGRRKKEGSIELLVDLASEVPWWVGASLAVATYAFLHHYADPIPSASVKGMLIQSVCSVFQYVIPIALLLGAALSAWRALRAKKLLETVRARNLGEGVLDQTNWRDFETIVGQAFRERGFKVLETGGATADGGVDLVLTQGQDKYLVQCKHWKARSVGVAVVRELFGVMSAQNAVGGFVVASGEFTRDAVDFARGRSIELVDARKLIVARSTEKATAHRSQSLAGGQSRKTCPKCGESMVRRTAKQGRLAGSYFWGCSKYPGCRGILPFEPEA